MHAVPTQHHIQPVLPLRKLYELQPQDGELPDVQIIYREERPHQNLPEPARVIGLLYLNLNMEPRRSVTALIAGRVRDLVLEQAGTGALLLNDLLMGEEGAKMFYELVPVNHRVLRHLEIKYLIVGMQGQ